MELKKNPNADLTRKTNLFFAIGLVVSLMLVIVAFEWKSYDEVDEIDMGIVDDDFEELVDIPITEQPPPPPPKIQQPEIIEIPDEEEIEEEIDLVIDLDVVEDAVIEDIQFEPEAAPKEEEADKIFEVVEQQPTPEGGMEAFYKFVGKELRYPSQASRMGVEGRVYVQFVVDEKGQVSEVKAVKGIGHGADEEAVRVIKLTKWTPGKQRGRAVKVRMVMPIVFKLN